MRLQTMLNHILVTLDGSELSEQALAYLDKIQAPSVIIAHWDRGMTDAVFLELRLEEGSSLNFIDYVYRQSGKAVPIIATASSASGCHEAQACADSVNELLVKPLVVNRIVEALTSSIKVFIGK